MNAIKKNAQQVQPEPMTNTSVDTGNNKGTVKMSTAVRNTQQLHPESNNTPVDTGEGNNADSILTLYRWEKVDVKDLSQNIADYVETLPKDQFKTRIIIFIKRGRSR